jgi:cobalt-zinc-cadmium efflux system protein
MAQSGEGIKAAVKARLAEEFGIQHSTLELEDLGNAHDGAQLYGHEETR